MGQPLFSLVAGDTFRDHVVSSVLPMCALLGDWVLALVMHVYGVKHELDREEARRVFDGMERRDLVKWTCRCCGLDVSPDTCGLDVCCCTMWR
ncbi:pentatricopeptide repeat-containing protein [Hordeum vulgare]|nr:pentatricopeptide repeat-containing protein [Hordeum vulgare]